MTHIMPGQVYRLGVLGLKKGTLVQERSL